MGEVISDLLEKAQAGRKKKTARRARRLSRQETRQRQTNGTWLSPVAQPSTAPGMVPCETNAPSDERHRAFIASAATNLRGIVEEGEAAFMQPVEESYHAHGFAPAVEGTRAPKPEALTRSVRNCPIRIPVSPGEGEAIASLARDAQGKPFAAALLYTWTEAGHIRQGRLISKDIFLIQVRHHTKLESHHDIDRPVYCINLKRFGEDCIDLRVMAIVKSEMPFLEAAAQAFSKEGDAYGGLPVVDHAGRVLIDERIVRRAGYCYSQYTRDLEAGALYAADLTAQQRMAHYLVMRAHLPELSYDARKKAFIFSRELFS